MPSYAVVGASRGIGLEFVRQLAAKADSEVFAVVRDVGSSLLKPLTDQHKNLLIIQGDVADHRSLERAAKEIVAVTGGALDVLIHNAARMNSTHIFRGFDDYKDLDELDADFIDAFKVNTLGVVHSVSAFLPLLRQGVKKEIVVISTAGASPALTVQHNSTGVVAYSTTKAAAVMVAAKYAVSLKPEGFTVISVHPGVVDTSETATEAHSFSFQSVVDGLIAIGVKAELLTPTQSVQAQLKIIDGLTTAQNGAFVSYAGDPIP
ncbi:NAD-P-binding protein [Trametes elegans]|nr:NAD-P-binding protein [Trametes elegans]